jgi:hypothetical protein
VLQFLGQDLPLFQQTVLLFDEDLHLLDSRSQDGRSR